jgi:acetylornithine deacetylase/succinyl-diaminopimelate desuccinylase-like protein
MAIDGVLAAIDHNLDKSLERLFELLRIPSVSTDPAFAGECDKAARWLAAELSALGFDASVRPTTGRPMVVARSRGEPLAKNPHVLFYGHYDVQPPDPLDLWETPPFEPRIREVGGRKRIVARGSADDKGQLMTFIEACRAFMAVDGKLPVPVTILFEGEEETGSPSLKPFLDANKQELKADVALVCDTDMWDAETPAVTTMLRGLVLEEVIVKGASHDRSGHRMVRNQRGRGQDLRRNRQPIRNAMDKPLSMAATSRNGSQTRIHGRRHLPTQE